MASSGSIDVTRPQYYTEVGIEPIKFINSHNLNFNLGNVVKYVARAGYKPGEDALKDLAKAEQYIKFEIERVLKQSEPEKV